MEPLCRGTLLVNTTVMLVKCCGIILALASKVKTNAGHTHPTLLVLYPTFCHTKELTPIRWNASPPQDYPQDFVTSMYFIHPGDRSRYRAKFPVKGKIMMIG